MAAEKGAKDKHSKPLQDLIGLIKRDWEGACRKYPDQTAFALHDDRVLAALEQRFAAEIGVRAIRPLNYEFCTGLHYLVFDFAPRGASLIPDATASFLTILDGTGKVIAVVDPFDPVQPNKFVPPLPSEGEQPFVLDRPTESRHVRFSDEAMYPIQVRSRAFFERLRGGGVMPGPIIDINSWTMCQWDTWTPYGTAVDAMVDDCGQR